jgi:PAS domain-containing protein
LHEIYQNARKRKKLKESEEQFQTTFESSMDAVMMFDVPKLNKSGKENYQLAHEFSLE